MNGTIFNIQRFCTHDGPGIRTVVFLKGCPLSCIWCHNPESHRTTPEIMYDIQKCLNCRLCASSCANNVHVWNGTIHSMKRNLCTSCGKCALVCPTDALEISGKVQSPSEVIKILLRDREFFLESGGGITLSGGEPLMQHDFSMQILREAKKAGIHTAVETSGYCARDLKEISKHIDLWLYDIKLSSEEDYIKYTGVSNRLILKNLFNLDSMGAQIILRCPIIPDINLNEQHFEYIVNLANSLKNIKSIQFAPYHPLGVEKNHLLGRTQIYENSSFLDKEKLLPYMERIQKNTDCEIGYV